MGSTSTAPNVWKAESRIVIVGGGLAGFATAIGARKAGFQVLVLEAAPQLFEIGAGIEVPPNSTRVLGSWGLLAPLEETALHVGSILQQDYRDGSILSRAPLDTFCKEKYGWPHLCVHRVDFHQILIKEAERLGVEVQLGITIEKIDFSAPAVHLRSGEVHEAILVIGADGQDSLTRELLLGHPDPPIPCGDTVYRMLLKQEDMRKHESSRALLDPLDFHMWSGPGGHAISYALQRGDEYNVCITQPDASTPVFRETKVDVEVLRPLFTKWDVRLRQLLNIATVTSKWALLENSDAPYWVHPKGKFTLVGDAAHAMYPFLGQGAAQAIEDAAALSTFLLHITSVAEIPAVLTVYEKMRRPRALKIKHRSADMRLMHAYPDGPQQDERNKLLRENEPYEGYPAAWADPVMQQYMWGYDILGEAEATWVACRGQ